MPFQYELLTLLYLFFRFLDYLSMAVTLEERMRSDGCMMTDNSGISYQQRMRSRHRNEGSMSELYVNIDCMEMLCVGLRLQRNKGFNVNDIQLEVIILMCTLVCLWQVFHNSIFPLDLQKK